MQDWLQELSDKFDCYFLLESYLPGNSAAIFEFTTTPSLKMSAGMDVWRLWIGQGDYTDVETKDLTWHAAEFGLVNISPPVERNNELVMAHFGTKTDWYDADNLRWDNPSLREFFLKLRATLKKRLRGPMWIADIATGEIGKKPVRDVRYSDGAKQWLANDGILVQQASGRFKYLTKESLPDGFLYN